MSFDRSLQIHSQADGELGFMTLSGQLMAESRYDVEQMIRQWTDNGVHFISVCCRDLTFIDSAGLSTLIGGMHRIRQVKGELVLCEMNPSIESLFEITMLTKYFKFFKTEQAAEDWLKQQAAEREKEGGVPDASEIKPAGKPKPRTKPLKKSTGQN